MDVNNLLAGSSPYQVLQEQAGKLASKWDKSGLLEGIESSTEKNNMSMLLENQAKQLVNEASSTGTDASIATGNSEAWAGVALPLVRRVFGEIVAKDLVSVQPMNLPAGLIFYLDFQYGSSTDGNKTSGESLYGAEPTLKRTDGAFNKGLYGAGEFAYSVTESTAFGLAPDAGATVGSASATFTGILNQDTEFSASHAGEFGATSGATSVVRVLKVHKSYLSGSDLSAVRAFKISSGSNLTAIDQFPQFTRVNGNFVEFVVSMSATADDEDDTFNVTYLLGPDNLDDRGDFEDSIPAAAVSLKQSLKLTLS